MEMPTIGIMSYTEKIDVLELLIDILREHEATLDRLVERLEKIVILAEGRDMR